MKKKALGKGLSALLKRSNNDNITTSSVNLVVEININEIKINPFQPRTNFKENTLNELAESIKELGIIQPLTVRRKNGLYELISGERRLRASKIAGIKNIPVYIRDVNDTTVLEMALVENIQRQELDAIEIAITYQQLINECNITQEKLSKRVGKDRTTIANYMRLLKLPPLIQAGLRDSMISMGHARSLLALESTPLQIELYRKIIAKKLSVRQTEFIIKTKKEGLSIKNKIQHTSLFHRQITNKLNAILKTKTEVKGNASGGGKITINFNDDNHLEDIVNQLK